MLSGVMTFISLGLNYDYEHFYFILLIGLFRCAEKLTELPPLKNGREEEIHPGRQLGGELLPTILW